MTVEAKPITFQDPEPYRRLIILILEPGKELEVETDGEFADWEIAAALARAEEQIVERMIDDDDNEEEEA